MLDKADDVITSIKKYFKGEWPDVATTTSPGLTSASDANSRPDGLSIAQWKAIQQRREREREASATLATSELDRWLQSLPIEADESSYKDHDFVLKWWRENHKQWPAMAAAARDLLACSASEVDVERLFSGCRDEYGLRRHSLKAETVRVMTLLRSAYEAQDQRDSDLIKYAMEQDVLINRNSILWRPADRIDGHTVGKYIIVLSLLDANLRFSADPNQPKESEGEVEIDSDDDIHDSPIPTTISTNIMEVDG
jgi:hypothetical protein